MPTDPLAQPLRLPCGHQLPNRLGKSAMSEALGTVDNRVVCFAYFAPRPAFNLKSSIVVSDSTDSDGCYTVESVPGNDGGLYVKNHGLWVRAV